MGRGCGVERAWGGRGKLEAVRTGSAHGFALCKDPKDFVVIIGASIP